MKKTDTNLLEESYRILISLGLSKSISSSKLKMSIEKLSKNKTDKLPFNAFQSAFHEFLIENKIVFTIDWKWQPDDIFYQIKCIFPSFAYHIVNQSFNKEKKEWYIKFYLDKRQFNENIPYESPFMLIEKSINPFLSTKFKKIIAEFDSGDDSYHFIVTPFRNYYTIVNNRFFPKPQAYHKPNIASKILHKIITRIGKNKPRKASSWKKVDAGQNEFHAFVYATEKRKKIIRSIGKRKKLLNKTKETYYKPKGEEPNPKEKFIFLHEIENMQNSSQLREVRKQKKYQILGEGNLKELKKIIDLFKLEEWGSITMTSKLYELHKEKELIYAFIYLIETNNIGDFISIKSYKKKYFEKAIKLLKVNRKDIIDESYPEMLKNKYEIHT